MATDFSTTHKEGTVVIREFFLKLGVQLGIGTGAIVPQKKFAPVWKEDLHGDKRILQVYYEWLIKQFKPHRPDRMDAEVSQDFIVTVRRFARYAIYKRVSEIYREDAPQHPRHRQLRAEAAELEEIYDWWSEVFEDFVRDHELEPLPT